jgi:hypothetical protein
MVLLSLVTCSRPATPTPFPVAPLPTVAAATGATAEALSVTLPEPTAPTALSRLDQYWAWMEEARATYPYAEPVEIMWAVMLCESEGNAGAVGFGRYYGLFQYTPETWAGEWNPYRAYSIFDPYAQIFATAKAWSEGYQLWWFGCLPKQ